MQITISTISFSSLSYLQLMLAKVLTQEKKKKKKEINQAVQNRIFIAQVKSSS